MKNKSVIQLGNVKHGCRYLTEFILLYTSSFLKYICRGIDFSALVTVRPQSVHARLQNLSAVVFESGFVAGR